MNFAIIGYGKMGKLYDALLNASYIVDVFPVDHRVYFSTVEEFIAYRQSVDLVIVCTPTYNHFLTVYKLLFAGYNVLCEKPLCFSSAEAICLETLAKCRKLILYQSTLERYNPMIKFLKTNIDAAEISQIESYRYGEQPIWQYTSDPKYDLGIHDIDLWFFLYKQKIPWKIHVGYGEKKREIIVHMKNHNSIFLDLLNKVIFHKNSHSNYDTLTINNPIIDMVSDILQKGTRANEAWSEEISIIEKTNFSNPVILKL